VSATVVPGRGAPNVEQRRAMMHVLLADRFKMAWHREIAGGVTTTLAAGEPPSVFVAVQEQLGLKLVSSRAAIPMIVIDRLERPTEN
jgi:hypothetical protein